VLTPPDEMSLVMEGPEMVVLVAEINVVPWRLVELLEDVDWVTDDGAVEVVDDVEAVVLVVDNEGPGELLTMGIRGVKLYPSGPTLATFEAGPTIISMA
jgi:hypothetical protein